MRGSRVERQLLKSVSFVALGTNRIELISPLEVWLRSVKAELWTTVGQWRHPREGQRVEKGDIQWKDTNRSQRIDSSLT